jgi:hypothetical protein
VTIDIEVKDQEDVRLGRQKVHDSASRGFALPRLAVDRSAWRDKAIRIYDPLPNPNQCHGECTGCAEAMLLNAMGNRVTARVLDLCDAHRLYADASSNDPWDGGMRFTEDGCRISGQDTGSSGLAAAKASVKQGLARDYRWEFGGGDGVIQQVMEGKPQSIGTWWYADMFGPSGGTFANLPIMKPTGGEAGGHQYVVRGYDADKDLALCRTWWGKTRDFWLSREHLDSLLRDGGDAHFTRSV